MFLTFIRRWLNLDCFHFAGDVRLPANTVRLDSSSEPIMNIDLRVINYPANIQDSQYSLWWYLRFIFLYNSFSSTLHVRLDFALGDLKISICRPMPAKPLSGLLCVCLHVDVLAFLVDWMTLSWPWPCTVQYHKWDKFNLLTTTCIWQTDACLWSALYYNNELCNSLICVLSL